MHESAKGGSAIPRGSGVALPAVLAALLAVAALGPGRAGGTAAPADGGADKPLELEMPGSLRMRHEAFHADFVKATKEGGNVGEAARSIEKLAEAHFAKAKEAFAPLGLLSRLAAGEVTPAMREAIGKAERLRAALPQIRRDHGELVIGLERLAESAKAEGKTDYARFAEQLTLHIGEEEEVLYPAALLVGEYLKRRLDK